MLEQPILAPHLAPVWQLFWLVHPSRQLSMAGPWYIPLSELLTAVQWQGWMTADDQRWALLLLQAMDDTYLTWWQERAALQRETERVRPKAR